MLIGITIPIRYERIKVAYEGLTQGVGEKVSLDLLTKVRCWVPPTSASQSRSRSEVSCDSASVGDGDTVPASTAGDR